ncbi:MAG: hypothetical protein NVSMB2_14710 [Chloroflexota bacterium]
MDPRDALAAQLGLEWVAAELAATGATQLDLDRLDDLLESAAGLIEAGSAFTECATAFHEAIADAAHNWAIQTSLRAIRELLHALHVQNTSPTRARRVLRTHRDIYAAIRAGDADRSGQLMRAHIGATSQAVGRQDPPAGGRL